MRPAKHPKRGGGSLGRIIHIFICFTSIRIQSGQKWLLTPKADS
jgi:hypothetical protein